MSKKLQDLVDLKPAEDARNVLLSGLTSLSRKTGCQLLLSAKSSKSPWFKIDMDDSFSLEYRRGIQEKIELLFESPISLLKYDAVIDGQNVGVAYKDEVLAFFNAIPKKNAVPIFSGVSSDFSERFKRRCVRIVIPGHGDILAFGTSSIKSVATYGDSNILGVFKSKKIVKSPGAGLLDVGLSVTFLIFKDFVYVAKDNNFSAMTGYRKVIQERAKIALSKLRNVKFLRVENFGALEKLCQDYPDFARRLSASDAQGFFEKLSHDRLLDSIKGFNISFKFDDDGETITLKPDFDDTKHKQDFQKLMTRVFAECALTGDKIEVLKSVPFSSN